jgi:hypothetical protein
MRTVPIALVAVALLGIPAGVAASGPIERIVERDHKTHIVQVVDDDVCGDVFGPAGRGAGTLHITETGHRQITVYEDRYHVVDVENGTFFYDYDDPTLADVTSRYVSPFSLVVNKGDDVHIMENQHEFVPGQPDGVRLWFRYHLTWRDDAPVVEREFFNVEGCP